MNFILLGKHNNQDTSVGKNMKSTVQRAFSDILLSATLMVKTDAEHVKMRFKTKAIPTTSAHHFPPIIRKQSTQLRTVGYRLKN